MARQIRIPVLNRRQLEAEFILSNPAAFREPLPPAKPVVQTEVQPRIVPGYGPVDGEGSIGVG